MNPQTELPQNERAELTAEEIELTTEAVDKLTLEHDPNSAASFLKEHPTCSAEFCLQTVERYDEKDRFTPALEIASVVDVLLITQLAPTERVELTPDEIELTTGAVNMLTVEHNPRGAASFLVEHKNCVAEFCLQTVEHYDEKDRFIPAQELAFVIEAILEEK